MTTWGVGTGRCGTKSLAMDIGGLHEPQPWFRQAAQQWWSGDRSKEDEILGILLHRMTLGVPIVDMHHSFIIPLIKRVDDSPYFIWLLRDPERCVDSLLDATTWTLEWYENTNELIRPDWANEGMQMGDPGRQVMAWWYYANVNYTIARELRGCQYEIRLTEELENWVNRRPG